MKDPTLNETMLKPRAHEYYVANKMHWGEKNKQKVGWYAPGKMKTLKNFTKNGRKENGYRNDNAWHCNTQNDL